MLELRAEFTTGGRLAGPETYTDLSYLDRALTGL
jgi:hypothetical protein